MLLLLHKADLDTAYTLSDAFAVQHATKITLTQQLIQVVEYRNSLTFFWIIYFILASINTVTLLRFMQCSCKCSESYEY